jgi:hypothetical protein
MKRTWYHIAQTYFVSSASNHTTKSIAGPLPYRKRVGKGVSFIYIKDLSISFEIHVMVKNLSRSCTNSY